MSSNKNKVVYQFYYTSYQISGTDENYDTIWEDIRYDLGASRDLKTGLEYYQYKYPGQNIQYQVIHIMDEFEE